MYVKICGTTNLEDAHLSVKLGAQALGFIFAPSKRRVTEAQVAAITGELPPEVERVGVFTKPDPDAIAATVQAAGLSAVQMHWAYSREIVAALRPKLGTGVRLWQVIGFPVEPDEDGAAERSFTERLRASLLDPAVDVVLLDSEKGGNSGGLGRPFPWMRAAMLLEREKESAARRMLGTSQHLPQIMLAGGLNRENVAQAVQILGPDGVDVVSGVEAVPGRKSPERLGAFFEAVRVGAVRAAGDAPSPTAKAGNLV